MPNGSLSRCSTRYSERTRSYEKELLKTAIDYKSEWECEFERRKRLGITDAPLPSLHPDRIKIDAENDTVWVVEPLTEEEKILDERWIVQKPA